MRRSLRAALAPALLYLTSACAAQTPAHPYGEAPSALPVAAPHAAPGATPEIGDLLDLIDIGHFSRGTMSASPDGQTIALVQGRMRLASNDYQRELVLIDVATGAARVVADAGGFLLHDDNGKNHGIERDRHPVWRPDSGAVAFLIGESGEGRLGVFELENNRVRTLTNASLNIAKIEAWSSDGASISVQAIPNAAQIAARSLRFREDGFVVDDEYAPIYAPLPFYRTDTDEAHWRIDASSGEASLSARVSQTDTHGPRAWSEPVNPNTNVASPVRHVLYRADQGEPLACPAEQCRGEIGPAWIDADGDQIVFQRREGASLDIYAFYAWRPASGEVRLIRSAEETDTDCALVARAIYCLRETSLSPRHVARTEIDDGSIEVVYDPNPHWHRLHMPRVERLDAHDQFGEHTFAHLVYPSDYDPSRRYPLVVVQYKSYGFLRGGTGNEYPILPLAARGYFVLDVSRPEPRAMRARLPSSQIEGPNERSGAEFLMKHSGLEALLDLASERASIDPGRIAITGLSDGAETVFYEITTSRRYSLALTSSAPTDRMDWSLNAQSFRDGLRDDHGPTYSALNGEGVWAAWQQNMETVVRAERIEAPLLMQLTDSENLSAAPLYARMRELNLPVELWIYPGEYHLKYQPRHIALQQIRALDWIDFWFNGVERPDPVDPDRLARWRRLREAMPPAREARPN